MQHYRLVRTTVPSLPVLTYILPEHIPPHVACPGMFVSVPVGRRQVSGIIVGETRFPPKHIKQIRAITSCADFPAVKPSFIRFMEILADYYLADPGRAFDLCLPPPAYFSADIISIPYVALADTPPLFDDLTDKRRTLLQIIKDNDGPMPKADACKLAACSAGVLNVLNKSGYVRFFTHEVSAEKMPAPIHVKESHPLNDEQQEAAKHIISDAGVFGVTLLQGVTGSGKTEVFFAAAEDILKKDPSAQILFLMPEIALTRQMRDRVTARFGAEPLLRHAAASDAAKKKAFRAAATGVSCIVLGARSALFLPFRNLKLIVLDEEHDGAYKQQEGVCYHARDMTVVRAKLESCPAVLASATPSMESLHNANTGKYRKVNLYSRFGTATMPTTTLIDLRKTPAKRGNTLSSPLISAIEQTLAQNGQALLFLNKRGYAPLTLCRKCGYVEECHACSARMVFHRKHDALMCHYCGATRSAIAACPSCGSEEERAMCGPGAEKLFEETQRHFPDHNVALMTGDSGAKESEAILKKLASGELHILVGTQIVSKGLHFPGLQLVGMADADMALYGSDPRSAERAWQLIRQTSGRAGRGDTPGRVMIQTHAPEHPLYRLLSGNNAEAFPLQELQIREESRMPPFTKLACVRFSAPNEQRAAQCAGNFADLVRRSGEQLPPAEKDIFAVYGPAAPPIAKRAHIYYSRLVVRARTHATVKHVLQQTLSRYITDKQVTLHIDIDPYGDM